MQNEKNITVFGATGKIGSSLLLLLSDSGCRVTAVTRDLNKSVPLPNVTWVAADMADPASLYPTMTAGSKVFLASGMSEDFVEIQQNVIEVAGDQNVTHIVKLSSGTADKHSGFYISKAHGEVEEILQRSGIDWTMIRPNGFMQNWLGEFAQTVQNEHAIYEATGDGKRPYIDIHDIAAVAHAILVQPEKHAGKIYALTGDEALNYAQIAAIISEVTGTPVTFFPLTPEAFQQRMEQKGMPAWAIKTFLSYAALQREGKATTVSTAVRDVLGRPARTVQAFIKEHAGWFK